VHGTSVKTALAREMHDCAHAASKQKAQEA